ncbi:MAG: S41 family peptidase [Prosthecobacter sp.]
MKRLAFLLGLGTAAVAAEPEATDISQAGIQSAFRILQKEYIRSNDLTFDELNRAALAGLLQRLDFGAELIPRKLEEVPDALKGVQAEMLTAQTGYIRPLALTKREVGEIEQHLRQFLEAKADHLILDLRTPSPPGGFNDAADLLSLFVPKGEVLFKMKQMGQTRSEAEANTREPVWTLPLLVLVDDETNNLGETIAAVLRLRRQALLIGGPTRGGAVRYETVPVDAEWSLRFARAEVLLADDSSVFKKGLKPDFEILLDAAAKHQVFEASAKTNVKDVITERPRKRFNEAALVADKNPELDAYIRRSAGESLPEDEVKPRDTVLQRALDLVITRTLFEAAKIDWKKKPSTGGKSSTRKAIPVTQ